MDIIIENLLVPDNLVVQKVSTENDLISCVALGFTTCVSIHIWVEIWLWFFFCGLKIEMY